MLTPSTLCCLLFSLAETKLYRAGLGNILFAVDLPHEQ
jgi:hypothetical protein